MNQEELKVVDIVSTPGRTGLEFIDDTLETLTIDITPLSMISAGLVEGMRATAEKREAALLTANQFGFKERIAFIGIKGIGMVCNVDVTPLSASSESASSESPAMLYKKPVQIFSSDQQKILVPVYPVLDVKYQKMGDDEVQTIKSTDTNHNLIWYGAEMLLNGTLDWCAWDYGTLKRDTRKIGPNDPCPCGRVKSDGKPVKYKKCCKG